METLTVWLLLMILKGGEMKAEAYDAPDACRVALAAASLADDVIVLSADCYEVTLRSTGRAEKKQSG